MKNLFTFTLLSFFFFLSTNVTAQKYAVYFTDKENTPYSINNPEAYLSQRALDRRARHGIAIDDKDLPVDPQYIEALRDLGAIVPFTSKWLNCALVSCSPTIMNQIAQLPFVSEVVYASPHNYGGKSGEEGFISKFVNKLEKEEDFISIDAKDIKTEYQYGNGHDQINQLNGIPVHQQGFTGEGVLIAVLDAGFQNVNSLPVFSSIYNENRMVLEMDVVVPNGNIYLSNTSISKTILFSE